MKRILTVFWLAVLACPVHAQTTPAISIQVMSIYSNPIKQISISASDDGDYSATFQPEGNRNGKEALFPLIKLTGKDFAGGISEFTLEAVFASSAEGKPDVTMSVPLRLMRPTRDLTKEIRINGKGVNAADYATPLQEVIQKQNDRLAYDAYSTCKTAFRTACAHRSFRISSVLCWLKANRSMTLATGPKYRRLFGMDKEAITEAEIVAGFIRTDHEWRDAQAQSLFPKVPLAEIEDDIRVLKLSIWRLFSVGEISELDKVYGAGSACPVFRYYRDTYALLDEAQRKILTSESIGASSADLAKLTDPSGTILSDPNCTPML